MFEGMKMNVNTLLDVLDVIAFFCGCCLLILSAIDKNISATIAWFNMVVWVGIAMIRKNNN